MRIYFHTALLLLAIAIGMAESLAQRSFSVNAAQVFHSSQTHNIRTTRLDDEHFVLTYSEGTWPSNNLGIYARVGQVDTTTNTIEWGTALSIESGVEIYAPQVMALNDSQVVIGYGIDDEVDYGAARILTIDKSTDIITKSNAQQFFNSGIASNPSDYEDISMVRLSDTAFAICFAESGSRDGKMVIGKSTNGSSLTFSSAHEWSSGPVRYIWMDKLSSSKVAFSYEVENSIDSGNVIVATIQDTSVTFGSATTFFANGSKHTFFFTALKSTSDSTFVVAYSNNTDVKGYAIVGQVSGTNVSFGAPYIMYDGASVLGPFHIVISEAYGYYTDDQEVAIAFSTASNDTSYLVTARAEDTVLSFYSDTLYTSEVKDPSLLGLNNNTLIAAYFDDDNADVGLANVIRLTPESTDMPAPVAPTNLSSLVPGAGYALEFDGVNDVVEVTTDSSFDMTDNFSVEMWVKVDDLAEFPWMFEFEDQYWGHIESDGDIRQRIATSSGNQFHENINFGFVADEWIHFAMSWDGTNTRYYKNGILTDTKSTTGTLGAGGAKLTIGALDNTTQYHFPGQIDEFRVWNSVISQSDIRDWMCRRLDSSRTDLDSLAAYYRFDAGADSILYDYYSGNHGVLTNMNSSSDWVLSGAAIGDESVYTYSGSSVLDTLSNGNVITLDDFAGADGMHLFFVNDTATGSSFPASIDDPDLAQYFGAFMVGGSSYDVTIDYTNNNVINGQSNELQARALKRSGGDDADWEVATGYFNTDQTNNTISILNQTGTEYVTGFSNSAYPESPGAGYTLDFDGNNDYINLGTSSALKPTDRLTIECWANLDDWTAEAALISNTQIGGYEIWSEGGSDEIQGLVRRNNSYAYVIIPTDSISAGWHHFALTYDGRYTKIYLDGILYDTDDAGGNYTIQYFPNSTLIGAEAGFGSIPQAGTYADGMIDEVRFWDTDLSSDLLRKWMAMKLNANHDSIANLTGYYRFDDGSGSTLVDLTGGNNGSLQNMSATTDWVGSGAALGDESKFTYSGTQITDTLNNGNIVLIDDFDGSDGIHYYVVNDTAEGSTYPASSEVDSTNYIGVFMVGGSSYDVTIDYTNNTAINGNSNEANLRGIKRSGGDDSTWEVATGFFNTNTASNSLEINNQTGTEYVTGFASSTYPNLPGSGYAVDFDGVNDVVTFGKVGLPDGLTYTAWINTTSNDSTVGYNGNTALTVIGDHTGDVWNGFGIQGGKITYKHYTGSWDSLVGNSLINDGEWHHIAVSHKQSNGQVNLYVDGVLDATGNLAYGGGGGELKVGFDRIGGGYLDGAGSQDFFDGKIDEVSAWSTNLSQDQIREWMCQKLNANHDSISSLVAYFKCDESSGIVLEDIAGGQNGTLTNGPGWLVSGAAIGDVSTFTYNTVSQLLDTLSNGNEITVDDFGGATGIHLYTVNDTAELSTYSSLIASADSTEYFGVYMIGGSTYDVKIDYSNNALLNGGTQEVRIRGIKRTGNDDSTWEIANGEFRTDTGSKTIFILNQSGTEYVTGFANTTYPVSPGSGYALDLNGTNDHALTTNSGLSGFSTTDSITLEAWIKLDTATSSFDYIYDSESAGTAKFRVLLQGGRPRFTIRGVNNNAFGIECTESINDNKWHHLAYVYDGSESTTGMDIFVDGINAPTTNATNSSITSGSFSDTSHIGIQEALTHPLLGVLDEIRIWNAQLDSTTIRNWLAKKLNANHPFSSDLLSYYRFDEGSSTSVADLVGGANAAFVNSPTWGHSGAALGDESKLIYGAFTSLSDTLNNSNIITVDEFTGADGIHLYTVSDTAEGSSYPNQIGTSVDSTEYFGVFMVGGFSYDVTIDYSGNAAITGSAIESQVRGVKRSGGDDATWALATGELRTDVSANTISILNQTGTEYVTGFVNTVYPVRPGSGYTLDFDGGNDFIELGNNPSLTFTDRMTIEFWAKTDATVGNYNTLVSKWYSAGDVNGGSYSFFYTNSGFAFGLQDTGNASITLQSGQFFNDGKWHHFAGSWDGDSARLYADGILVGTVGSAGFGDFLDQDTRSTRIGTDDRYTAGTGDRHFDGSIDEVRFWRAQLSESTIREWMTKKVTNAHSQIDALEAYYRFDEAADTILQDLAGGNTGILTNMDASTDWVYSGAALGDESKLSYGAFTSLSDTLNNGNIITVDDFTGADGIHLYTVNDTAVGSNYPGTIGNSADSAQYYGVYMVGGSSYDVTIDYGSNAAIASSSFESRVRGVKRSGGDDSSWQLSTGEFRTNTTANTISIFNQTGTEYVTGFVANDYPSPPGSGYALDFDGTDDQVYIGDVLPDYGSFTVSAWFKPNSFSTSGTFQESFFVRGLDGSGAGWSVAFFVRSDSTLNGAIVPASGSQVNTFNSVKLNTTDWHHAALTWDTSSAELTLYIDGELQTSSTGASDTLRNSTLGSFIGRGNLASEAFDGQVDELAIWNTVLDSSAIRQWMCRKTDTTHQNMDDMLAYYRFDEGENDSLIDLVGGNDGPLQNMTASSDWLLSGASIGDTSSFDYDGASIVLSSPQGDAVEVSHFSGNGSALHVYRVDQAPNNTTIPLGSISMDTTHYYGYFIAGGNNPKANIEMDYSGNATYTSQNNGDDLAFLGRDNNADTEWSTKASSIFSNFTAQDTLRVFGQDNATEIIVGQTEYLTPPGSGYALDFDGTNDFVETEGAILNPGNSNFTAELWFRKDSASNQVFLGQEDGSGTAGRIWLQNTSASEMRTFLGGSATIETGTVTNLGTKWHHAAVSYDGDSIRMYKDGVLIFTRSVTPESCDGEFLIGKGKSGGALTDGNIDEVRIWNTALDQSVIRKWMSRKVDISHDSIANLVSYYRFDQQGDTNLIDLIGGNHASLENMDETSDWVTSGAAIGDISVYTYDSNALAIELPNNDSVILNNFDNGVNGIQLYYVAERSNFIDFYGAQSVDTTFYFGVHKVGPDTATYDVTMRYGNSSQLTGASAQYRVGIASRDNNADVSWESKWFEGSTNTGTETIFLPNQTGTEYAGIVSANNALNFDGSNDHVTVPSDTSFNFDTDEDFTVSLWAKIPVNQTNTGYDRNELITKRSGSSQFPFAIRVNNQTSSNPGKIYAAQKSGSIVSGVHSSTTVNDNSWHHIAYTKNGSKLQLFIDGVGDSITTDLSNGLTSNSGPLRIGRRDVTSSLNGTIDEVRIWSRALCEEEIVATMNCQFDSLGKDSLVVYYSFNQGVADSINTGLDSLIDLSGNGNNGTLNVMSLSGIGSNWTTGATGISGVCDPYISPVVMVLSEGDTILNYDSTANAADSTYFGDVVLQTTKTVNFEIYNDGGDTLDIDSVFFTGQDSAMFFALHSNNIAPGATGFISMQVTPTVSDTIEAYLNLATNDCGNSPYRFQVRGNVLGYAGALNFDGVNDYVNISDTLGYVGMKEFTVEAWVRIDASNGGLQAIMSATGTELFHLQVSNSGADNNVFYTNNGIVSLPVFPEAPLDEWRHFAMVAKSGESNVFIDGSLYGTGNTTTFDSILVTNNIRIGSGFGSSRFLNGDIDEVRLWDRALDSAEIQANMSCELEGTECGLIAYYNFNSDTAKTFANNAGILTVDDSSGNGHVGALTNFALSGDSSNWTGQSDSIFNNCIDNGDLVGPVVIPVDTLVVYLDTNGYALIDSNQADSASCDYYSGIASYSVSMDTVYCANDGDTLTLSATDSAGLGGSADFIVKVIDTIPPTVITQNVTVYLDSSGSASINAANVNNGSSDHCGIDSLWLSDTLFNCADTVGDSIWLIVRDVNGNIDSTIANITVEDTIAPIVQAQSIIVYLDSSGIVSLDTSDLVLSAVDNCDIDSMWLSQTDFSCADTNGVVDTLFVIDSHGNINSDTATVYIHDTIAPYLNLSATTLYLDTSGQLSIEYGDLVSSETTYFIQQADLTNWSAYSSCSGFTRLISTGGLETWSWTDNFSSGTVIDSAKIELNWGFSGTGATRTYALNGNALGSSPGPNFGACAWGQVSFDLDTAHYNVGSSNSFTWDIIASTYVIFPNPDWSGAYAKVTVYTSQAFDNCSDSSQISYTLSDTNFSCSDTGANTVVVSATDLSGNSITDSVIITILDTVLPEVITKNITVYLDTSGNVSILADSVNDSSSDNCAIDSLWLSDTSFSCVDTIGDTIWLFARDVSANIDSAQAVISIMDTISPVVNAQSIQVYLDSSGSATIAADSIDFGSTDNCAIDSIWLDQYTFGCADSIGTIVTLFARDVSGNTSSDTTVIYTVDTIPPTLSVTNDTIYIYVATVATLDTGDVNSGTSDNCQVDSIWLGQTTFNCFDTVSPVMFFAKDVSGNVDSLGITVIVVDTVSPIIVAQNITVYLDSAGLITIDTGDLNNGSSDNCLLDSLWLSASSFNCSDSLDTTITLFGQDKSGNISSATGVVTILDTIRPQALVNNITIYLDSNGMATIAADTIDSASTDNCSVDSIWLSKNSFVCADTSAPDTVMFFVRDVSGNRDSAMAIVNVLDTQPAVVIPRNLTVYLDVNGGVTFTADTIDSASSDNCLVDSIWISNDTLSCADSNANNITLFVRDVSGNVDSAISIVTVVDTVLPTVFTRNQTVYLDAAGSLTISPDTLDSNSFDNCNVDSTWLSANTFTCADTNDTVLWLFVKDVSGNVDSANATLTILDTLPPVIITNNVTVYLDSSGFANILPDTVDNGTTDNCDIATTWLSDSTFSCTDTATTNTVWFYAQDISGNIDSSTAIVTVLDTMPPAISTVNLVIHLDSNGTISIANDSADAGTSDNCLLDSIWLSQTTYDCSDVGSNSITFFAQDVSGNVDSTTITVTVQDTIAPVVIAQGLTLALDSFGSRIITALDINNGSWDSCGIASYVIDTDTFDCSDVGTSTTITLTVTDVNGNSSTDTSTVTISDDIAPEVITQNITVYLDNSGSVSITTGMVDNGTWDSCGVNSLSLDNTTFDCSDVGANVVTLTAEDVNGNANSATATVTVVDSLFPLAIAYTDTIIIYLDSFGEATIAADTIDSNSSDNCSFTKAIDNTFFTCVDAGYSHPVVLTITDASGNISLDTGYVFVDDTIPPVPNTFDTITVSLDSFGMVSIDTSDVLIAISDSCAIASINIDSSDFTCANTSAPITVTTIIADTNGNVGSDSTVVIVVDDIHPQAFLNDTVIYLNDTSSGNGTVIIDSASLDSASYDVCGIQSIVHQTTFTCADIGVNSVTVTITDVNGNVTTDSVNVEVLDTVAPKIFAFAQLDFYLNSLGVRPIAANTLDSASFDNCAITSKTRSPAIVGCNRVGDTNLIGLSIFDQSGNTATDTVLGFVFDTVAPQPNLQNIEIYLDTTGNLTIQGDTVDSASTDACGIDTIWLSKNTYNCGDVGLDTVRVFIRDVNMNVDSSQTVVITIVDTLAPITYSIDSLTVFLNDSGVITIEPADIDSGSWDSCGIASYVLSDSLFTCADVGVFPSTILSVTDIYGNTGTSNTIVEVIDTVRPVAIPNDTTVFYLDANGQLTITGFDLDSASYDSCGLSTFSSDTINFDCGNIGTPITALFTVVDNNGNEDSTTTIIVILDTVSPIAITQNISVYLDTTGNVSITPAMVNNGSNDSCGVDTMYIDTSNFSCANTVAPVPVTLTVEDVNGNSSTAISLVTVIDTVAPIVTSHDTTMYLDVNGQVVLDTSFINNGSSDNCFIDTMTLSQDTFTCAEAGQTLAITLTAFDGSGNSDTSTANVTILDTVRPEPIVRNIDLYLDANGTASITASMIDSASYDSCGVDSIWLDIYDFDCGDVGDNDVEFFIRDVNTNSDSSIVTVTVIDTVTPNAITIPTLTVWLDNNGDASISRDDVNNGSYDSCGITDYYLNDSIFDCSDLGAFPTVVLTVVDVNGNVDSAQTVITVLDTIAPVAVATNFTAYLNSGGSITIDSSNVNNSSTDNCSIATITLDTFTFDCSDIGETNPVIMTVTDHSGNSDTALSLITILDTVPPVAIGQNITIELDSFGSVTIDFLL